MRVVRISERGMQAMLEGRVLQAGKCLAMAVHVKHAPRTRTATSCGPVV